MLYKLETAYKDPYKREKAAVFFELKRVKDTIEFSKTPEEKKVLGQHIKALRKQLQRYQVGNITYKLRRGSIVIENRIGDYTKLHSNLIATKKYLIEKLKIERQVRKTMQFRIKDVRGIKRTFIGGVNSTSGTISKAYLQKKVMEIKNEKGPKSNERHIGVEIEFASILSEAAIGRLFFEEGLTPYVQLMDEFTDGKDEDNEKGREIAVVAPESEIFSVMEKVCYVLNEKIDANVTYGCGLHVHIDCRNRDIKKVFQNFFNTQEILYSMVSYVRRNNRHVKMLPEKIMYPNVNGDGEYFCPTCSDPDEGEFVNNCKHEPPREVRYFGLNGWAYKHHKTMEIRIHSGTTNFNKIKNWINLLLKIADAGIIKKEITEPQLLFKTINVSEDLKNYVLRRIETFKQKQ